MVIEYYSSKRNPGALSFKGEKITHFLSAFRGREGGLKKRTFCPLALMCANVTPSLRIKRISYWKLKKKV